ncbi:aminotransferase class I/II-fold pyridoxal phosphate-dependent enzyme, partial [Actinocorallia lasiicapitis]
GALLIVDEAHALGVVGEGGRGGCAAAGIAGEPDVIMTLTLSKSLASQGGAVLGAPEVIETMIDTARSFIFDTGLNPAAAAAALAALEIITESPELPAKARTNGRAIAKLAESLGLESRVPDAAVVPVFLGEPLAALKAAETCLERGLRVGCFRPPSVPVGRACLRITARASLTETELTGLDLGLRAVAGLTHP